MQFFALIVMITLKTPEEIQSMKHGGQILHTVLRKAAESVEVGMSGNELNDMIESLIIEAGGEPGFKKVEGYDWGSCICINDQIVHTPPSERTFKDGDVVTIDAGVFYDGLHTDSATTVQIGSKTREVQAFLETGKAALKKAIKVAKAGNRVGHISEVFQKEIEGAGYSIVRELTGHGVGYELHEDPYVPCFVSRPIKKTLLLKPGMTLALEVMYAMGGAQIEQESDGWSLKMSDSSHAATFEHTIAITEKRTFILT